MSFDWFTSSVDARRILYDVTKRVVASHFLGDWNAFLRAVLGDQSNVGSGYVDNFRAGRISRVRAGAIARWLDEHDPMLARDLTQALNAQSTSAEVLWNELMVERAITGGLSLVKMEHLRIVSFAQRSSDAISTLRIGEAFCLKLSCRIEGRAMGLQREGALWFPLPLSDSETTITVEPVEQVLPRSIQGDVIPLSEQSYTGHIEFVILVSSALWLPAFAQCLSHDQPIDLEKLCALTSADLSADLHRTSAIII